jgi:hypothetical protein
VVSILTSEAPLRRYGIGMTSMIRLTYLGTDGDGEDAGAPPLALPCEIQYWIDTLVAVAADCPNRSAQEPSWRLSEVVRSVNSAAGALGDEA